MKKLKMKVRAVKPRMKIIEPAGEHVSPVSAPVSSSNTSNSTTNSSLESKTTSSALPLIKQDKSGKAQQAQSPRQTQSRGTGQEPNADERIFISYDRFSMSDNEKRKAYSLDIRGSAPAKQTATIERTSAGPTFTRNPNEIRPMERGGDGHMVESRETSLADNDAHSKYSEESVAKYKARRQSDFF
jgi:hypothetical protein